MRFLASGLIFALAALPLAAQETAQEPAAEETAVNAETVIATVNGEDITLGDLVALRAELPPQYQSLPDQALYSGLLTQLTNQILLRQAADKDGLAETPAVKRALAFQRTSLLADVYLRQKLAERLTPELIEAEYQKRYVEAEAPKQYKARHILVPEEAEAQEIAAEVAKEDADFAETAKARSKGPSAPNGGDLGWFEKGQMVPEFEAAATGLQPGEISAPVQTQFGWHVILLEDVRDRPVPPLDEVRQELSEALTMEATQAVIDEEVAKGEVARAEGEPGLDQLRNDSLIAE